ncbi:MAG: T9SS type A sorting domain-containing protein [Porphyromonadaceae bacterium]|nr:T9SS type A sorting domain-containing protein [Porphyromonadaceae bacterium]
MCLHAQTFTNFQAGLNSFFGGGLEHNGLIYFTATTPSTGNELWVTDGTHFGTKTVREINPGTNSALVSYLISFNNKVLFSANNGTHGRELWETDGTYTGTKMIKDINPGAQHSSPGPFLYYSVGPMIHQQMLIFSANNGSTGIELYKYAQFINPLTSLFYWDVALIKDIDLGAGHSKPENFTIYKGKVYFSANEGTTHGKRGNELWVTDGTEGGTRVVRDINPGNGNSFPSHFAVSNDLLFFRADDGTNGAELWVTDGTIAGTKMVKNINASGGSYPMHLYSFNNKVYFSAADDGTKRNLWVSDGTTAGTKKVEGLYTSYSSMSFEPKDFTELNGELYFSGFRKQLWKLDNSTGKATRVRTINTSSAVEGVDFFTVYNGKLYFRGYTLANGHSLWESDGTYDGTKIIEPPVSTNTDPLGGTSFSMKAFSDGLYFNANFDSNGWSAWKVTTNPTSVDRISQADLSIYPNPVAERLNIRTDFTVKEIRLISMTGQTVGTWKNTQSVSLAGIDQGAYIVHIDTSEGTAVRKVMKK